MKKVLFFLPPTTGGAEKITTTFARMLDKEQFETAFVIVGRRKGDVVHYIPEGSRIIYVPALNMFDFVWQKFWFIMLREKPDYVFSSITPINCHIIHSAKIIGAKSIVRCNCAVDRIVGYNLNWARKYYPQADLVIAQTEQMRQGLISTLRIPSKKVITLHNPIEKKQIEEKANEEYPYTMYKNIKKYVWVGRFNEIKRVDTLVKAFSHVIKKEPDSKLFLVGKIVDNDYYKGIVKLVKDLGIGDNVVFTGFQANPYKWVKNADCLVLTSRSEASPNVVFESLYLGTPVVVSNCTPDLGQIVSGSNGIVVMVGDDEGTAEAMMKVKKNNQVSLKRKPGTEEDINAIFSI